MFHLFVPELDLADVIAGRIRLTLGGEEYVLPTKTIEQNEEWQAQINRQLLSLLNAAADPKSSDQDMVRLLFAMGPEMIDLLVSYDQDTIPAKDVIRAKAQPHEVIRAVATIWANANPLVGAGIAGGTTPTPAGPTSAPSRPSRPPTAGSRGRSASRSRTRSSSTTSTPPRSA
jgi:hypothetical protein